MKKRKVVLLIILTALLVALIALGWFAYKNFNTVKTMYYVFTGQNEVIKNINTDTDKVATEAIKKQGIESIRPLTDEETSKLNSGEMSEEDAIKIVLGQDEGKDNSSDDKQGGSNTGNTVNTGKGESPEYSAEEIKKKKDEIASLIGKMYVLKAQFTGQLDGIEDYVNDEYHRLVDEYGRDKIPASEKTKVAKIAYDKAYGLEAECDGQVNTILTRVEVLLKETGQDNTLVKQMKDAYESEKMVAKSHYMSRL